MLQQAIGGTRGSSSRNRAMYGAHLAATLAMSEDDAAMEQAAIVLAELEGPVLSPRARTAMSPVRAMAARTGAREFCARFDACDPSPQPRAPAPRMAESA